MYHAFIRYVYEVLPLTLHSFIQHGVNVTMPSIYTDLQIWLPFMLTNHLVNNIPSCGLFRSISTSLRLVTEKFHNTCHLKY